MRRFISTHWPLVAMHILLWIIIGVLLLSTLSRAQRHFVYTLDDPYIHMSMAKHLVRNGVWGLNAYEFSSSSSSPLWTLLLAGVYAIFGISAISPFILNIVLCSLLLYSLYCIARSYRLSDMTICSVLGAVILGTPLSVLVFCGQEHIMHALFSVLFLHNVMQVMEQRHKPSEYKPAISFLILSVVLTSIRYEGIFLILLAGIFFFASRRRIIAGSILIGGALPIVVYGVISYAHGWYFIPNPILLKGNFPSYSLHGLIEFLSVFVRNLYRTPHMLFLLLGILGLIIIPHKGKERQCHIQLFLGLIAGMILLHVLFAKVGWFYRYEAYLIVVGIFGLVVGVQNGYVKPLRDFIRSGSTITRLSLLIICGLVLIPFLGRSIKAHTRVPAACKNIYQQQFQMGLFLQRYYTGECVGANDIGLISFLADIRCIDLWGLASIQVAKKILNNEYDDQSMACLVHDAGCKAVVVYDSWLKHYGGVPSQWMQIEQWHIHGNVVCGDSVVTWYAPKVNYASELEDNLKDFHEHLKQAGGIVGE